MNVLPSTSVIVEPVASAAKIGRWTSRGCATALRSRSRISRERGPGISVRMSIALVTDMAVSVAAGAGYPTPGGLGPTLARMDAADLDPDPLAQLGNWLAAAWETGIVNAEAMALATTSSSGHPSVRMVLAKGCDVRGLSFFTNLESRKAV